MKSLKDRTMLGNIEMKNRFVRARQLDSLGIDAVETSGSWMAHKPADRTCYHDAAAVLARELRCAVIQTGGNREFATLEQQLNASGVDYFGFARPFMSEPDFVNKLPARRDPEAPLRQLQLLHPRSEERLRVREGEAQGGMSGQGTNRQGRGLFPQPLRFQNFGFFAKAQRPCDALGNVCFCRYLPVKHAFFSKTLK